MSHDSLMNDEGRIGGRVETRLLMSHVSLMNEPRLDYESVKLRQQNWRESQDLPVKESRLWMRQVSCIWMSHVYEGWWENWREGRVSLMSEAYVSLMDESRLTYE